MTRRSISRLAFEVLAACLLLTIPYSSAFAGETTTKEEGRQVRTSREILLREDSETQKKRSWLSPNFHLHEKSGIAYAKKLQWGDRPLVLRVRGPVMRKQKALGLRFNLNF